MQFNEIMRAKREDMDIRQEDLGEEIGLTQREISRLERGDTQPTIEEIKKICIFFNLSADYMLGIINEPRQIK